MSPSPTRQVLASSHRAVLEAVARRIVPRAYEGEAPVDLVARIEERLACAPPDRVRDVRLALTILGSRLPALLFSGFVAPFPRLPVEKQDLLLTRWATSPVDAARAVYQGLRRLVLGVYYSQPESFADIGYLGPYWSRGPRFPWEGPVPDGTGTRTVGATAPPSASEPVARGSSGSATVARAAAPALSLPPAAHSAGRVTADVIVIGSGAGGGVTAARLAEAGRDVLVLEAGSLVQGEELDEREGEMTARLYADGGMRATDDLSIILLQGGAVGGGTLVNWMITFRAPDFVLDEWVRRFGLHGFSAAELAPVFERVEREIHATLVPDDAHSPANRLLLDGARRLGWRAGPARINARGCVRAGFCGLGCRYGAKQSADRVYLPRALAAGARLLPDVRADRVEVMERDGGAAAAARGGRRTTSPLKRVHATVLDRHTRQPVGVMTADAPVVVLAAGAVETPAILQRSALGGGGVGRYLRLHPTTAVAGECDHDVYAAGGIPLSAACDEFLQRDASGYGFWIETAPYHPALSAVAASGFGAEHHELMRRFRRTTNLIVLVRDGSDLDMSNGSVALSRGGRPRIRYRVGPRDRANLEAGVEAAARILFAAGVKDVRTLHTRAPSMHDERDIGMLRHCGWGPNDLTLFSAHVNGTCRLGTDPRVSGANPDGERHGVRGLYVADGSLLPTSLGVNPQATIMALATVVAERIAAATG